MAVVQDTLQPGMERSLLLSILCFALADVRDGLGPFLGVFLQSKGWTPDTIGLVTSLGGFAGMLAAVPTGALADATHHKRLFLAFASGSIVFLSLLVLRVPTCGVAAFSQVTQGIMAAAIAPLLSGITLGMVGFRHFSARLGRNEAWNHAGNASTALAAGLLGYFWGIAAAFVVMFVMGILSVSCVLGIRSEHIDYNTARGRLSSADSSSGHSAACKKELHKNPALLCFGLTLLFFHLGNAALLPLLGQSAVARFEVNGAAYTAGTVILAQATMLLVALWGSRVAQKKGYGWLFLLALLALPLRGAIAGLWTSPWNILPVQMLDGVGAGLLGVATPGIVARLLQGSGHINMGLGLVLTIQGVGASLSNTYGGLFAHHASYSAAFLALAAAPCLGLALFLAAIRAMPSLAGTLKPVEGHTA